MTETLLSFCLITYSFKARNRKWILPMGPIEREKKTSAGDGDLAPPYQRHVNMVTSRHSKDLLFRKFFIPNTALKGALFRILTLTLNLTLTITLTLTLI